MLKFLIIVLYTLLTVTFVISAKHDTTKSTKQKAEYYDFDMLDLLGLGDRPMLKKHISLNHSASKFLLEMYTDLTEKESENNARARREINSSVRYKRSIRDDAASVPDFYLEELQHCNNIITFSSRTCKDVPPANGTYDKSTDMLLNFNTERVERDLQLVHSSLRIYQDQSLGNYRRFSNAFNVTVSIYQRYSANPQNANRLHILSSLNTTTAYTGWLEFNVTRLLSKWIQRKETTQPIHSNDIVVSVLLQVPMPSGIELHAIPAADIGLIKVNNSKLADRQPFMIGYFDGPELITKINKLRFKRDLIKRHQRRADFGRAPPPLSSYNAYNLPKTCTRLNFTIDFEELQMHTWIIAPRKFEAFFCGGECHFPLNAAMNASHHAIVQTLMHLKKKVIPSPCCVPTKLANIPIIHYINDDSVNLSQYADIVATECGCL